MKKREVNCDILRILAFIFVVCVHFLLNTDFYNVPTKGLTMLFLNIARCLFITCVPLFIILSGYLMNKKEMNKEYIKKLSRVIVTYVLCGIVCLIFNHLYYQTPFSIKKDLFKMLSFEAAPYGWYINMYIGLYLLIPFLNVLWNNLKDKKQKQQLLIVLICLFILPTLLNTYNFNNLKDGILSLFSGNYQSLIPDYWLGNGYPILYYFIGCYLKEYKINISFWKNLLFLILEITLFGLFNYYRNYNAKFDWGIYAGYYSFEAFITAILVSILILNLKISLKNETITKFISKISYLTLGAYLLSKIFDILVYTFLKQHISSVANRVLYFIPCVLTVIICSLILAYIVDLIEKGIRSCIVIIRKNK